VAPNHLIDVPDPSVSIVTNCTVLPVEFVYRGYLTGSTDTSIWTAYERGERHYCGHDLPDGMKRHERLPEPLLTPTTKAELGAHDELTSREDIIGQGTLSEEVYAEAERIASQLFAAGTHFAKERGLILVDTKYELGLDPNGRIIVIDEIHTPDSSRYWVQATYEERYARGDEPESLDKEFLRLWLRDKGISDDNIPTLDDDIRVQVAERYVDLFERVTGTAFEPDLGDAPLLERIEQAIEPYFDGA